MTSRNAASANALRLARTLLDADVLPDDVGDVIAADEYLGELALARNAARNAEKARGCTDSDAGTLQGVVYDLDGVAKDRVAELLEDHELVVPNRSERNSVVDEPDVERMEAER